jgi:methionyl-tRNA synthetase
MLDVCTAEELIQKGDWKAVKKSDRDESIRVVIHLCMEAILGISLYNYPYLN